MQRLYFVLAAIHLVAIVVTGILWTIIDLVPNTKLRESFRDIKAVHFGSIYLTALFLGLAYAFDWLKVPAWHQGFFPLGLGLLVLFSSIGYVFPKPKDLDPWYYWTVGWPKVLALIGLACIVVGVLWTATVLVVYAVIY